MLFSLSLLAVSLSLDALGVGIVYGMRKIKIPFLSKLIICFFSILYSAISIMLGKYLSVMISASMAKILGVSILMLMGVFIILQGFLKESGNGGSLNHSKEKALFNLAIKSLGITIQVVRNPASYDIDKSGIIDKKESLLLGFALSVDAIGVGFGSALSGFHSWLIPPVVGLVQLSLLYSGLYIGNRFNQSNIKKRRVFSVLPGVLLIFLALIRVY